MSVFLTDLLTFFQTYGYPALWASVFISALGAPLPVGLALLAAGAFAALGDFNIYLLVLITVTASMAGDNLGYLIGRKWGSRVLSWLERSSIGASILPTGAVERSRVYFKRRGRWAVFLSRFLVAVLGGIINLVAGSELYPYRAFLVYDFAGETLSAVLPLTLGLAFGTSWEEVGNVLGAFSFFIIAVIIAGMLFSRLLRYLRSAKYKEEQKTGAQVIPGITPVIDPHATSSGPLPLS
jgi:membrane-associated protein